MRRHAPATAAPRAPFSLVLSPPFLAQGGAWPPPGLRLVRGLALATTADGSLTSTPPACATFIPSGVSGARDIRAVTTDGLMKHV